MSKSDKPDKSSKPEEDSNLIIEYCEDIFAKLKEEKENRLVTKQPKHSYSRHTATVLQDGRVLLISSDGSEIFDPKGDAFHCPEPSKLKQEANLAILLRDGRVLVVSSSRRQDTIQAELFDPVQETWEEIQAPKYDHA
ncbi:MAG: hypothetical protein HOK97_05000 [Deltaproteobacteria bacterium]|nr:hypothetical protein [Deltaproteobacteria bacterium]